MSMEVLVVDDNEAVATAVSHIFRRSGHVVTVAYCVKEAIQAANGVKMFDLIVSDMMMPDGTGADLHRWLDKTRPELGRKVVFHTGGIFDADAQQYVDNTGLEVIVKTNTARLFALAEAGVQ
jgi:CheY-like chemotaxis protein